MKRKREEAKIRLACQRLAEQDNPDLAAPPLDESKWTAWRTWHEITCISYSGAPMLDIIAKYLIKDGNPDELRLNEWMRYWYVYTHLPEECQQSLADTAAWPSVDDDTQLSEKLINFWPAAIMLLAERAKISPSFRQQLIKQLMDSKKDGSPQARIAAANALTILNAAGIPWEKDLRGIQVAVDRGNGRWQGPNLVGAMLSGVNLRGADLRGTILWRACLNQTGMQDAQLDQACFGYPYERAKKDLSPSHWPKFFPAAHGHTQIVTSASFSPDGTLVASGSYDTTIHLWDAMTGECLSILTGHAQPVTSVSFSPDGTLVASASRDNTIRIWDAMTGACLHRLEEHCGTVSSVSFSPVKKSSLLVSASYDKTGRIWDATTGECLHRLEGHCGTVSSVSFSPDGTLVASSSWDETVRIWSYVAQALSSPSQPAGEDVPSDGFNTSNAGKYTSLRILEDAYSHVTSVSFSPVTKSSLLASASDDNMIRIWNTTAGECLHRLEGHAAKVSSVSFSPDGTLVASASYDKTIRIWDTTTGACLRTLQGHMAEISSVSFSPDGTLVASASWDHTVHIWQVDSGQIRYILGEDQVSHTDVHGLDIENSQGLSKETIARLVEQGAKDPDAPAEDEKEEEA